jgi:hypothetical protein
MAELAVGGDRFGAARRLRLAAAELAAAEAERLALWLPVCLGAGGRCILR